MKKLLILIAAIIAMSTMIFAMTGCNNSLAQTLQNATEKTAVIAESYDGIEIISDTADLTFVPSEAGESKIEYFTHERIVYSATVENGVLKIECDDSRRWFEKMPDLGLVSTLTVYIPAGEYTSLTISQATGDIIIPADYKFGSVDIDLSTGNTKLYASANDSIKITASTGDITIENVSCDSLETKVSTGKTYLKTVTVAGDASITASTGDSVLENVSFKNLTTVATTGNITATELNGAESLSVERSTGDVSLRDVNCGEKVAVQTSTGKIEINNATCTDMTTAVSSGDTTLTDVSCTNFTTTGNTGDLNMTSLIASGKIDINRDTGNVHFAGCDAAEIYVTTSTGKVEGSLLTNKIFQVSTSTGKIDVPECWEGGKCKITTSTGKVTMRICQ